MPRLLHHISVRYRFKSSFADFDQETLLLKR